MRRIFTIMAALATLWAAAQDIIPDDTVMHVTPELDRMIALRNKQRVVYFGDEHMASNDSIRQLMDRFYVNQFRHFQDPQAPYFLMMSRDATLAMGIGGAVRMRAYYDFNGVMPSSGFLPYTIPIPADPTEGHRISATPSGTALFFQIIGINKTLGNFSAFIQGNFDGYNGRDFKLKKSYVIIRDWTVGYTTSSFVDPTANPPVIDGSGPNGQSNHTSVLLRWMKPIKGRWTVAASMEFPKNESGVDGKLTKKRNDWLPDFVAFGQYSWADEQGHVRLSGLLRTLSYYDLVSNRGHNAVGWGLQLSMVSPFDYNWKFYASVVGGKGLQSFMNDMSADKLDLLNNPGRPGRMYTPGALGYTAGVRYNFTQSIYASASVSQAHIYLRDGDHSTTYKRGLYCVANVFWDMSARLQVGLEALYGKRWDLDGQSGHANRVNALFMFSF